MLGIIDNISRCSFETDTVLEFQEARPLKECQAAATVGRVVRNRDDGAVRQSIDTLIFIAVNPHPHEDGIANRH